MLVGRWQLRQHKFLKINEAVFVNKKRMLKISIRFLFGTGIIYLNS